MALKDKYLSENITPLRINGEYKETSIVIDVKSPFNKKIVGRTVSATPDDIDTAVSIAKEALTSVPIPVHERSRILDSAAQAIAKYRDDFSQLICMESGKPIKTARIEVDRAIQTFLFSSSVSRTMSGKMIPLDAHPSGENHLAFTVREPIGVVAAIAPFNFPLNLVAHKIAPAIAAGVPVVLKPAHNTPLTSAALVDILIDECGLPPGYLSYVPCPGEVATRLSDNDDVSMISFTGSPQVGWAIRAAAPRKKVSLELGNNSPVIVCDDADLEKVAGLVASSGYSYQGQSCISVQRVYVHESVYESFINTLKTKVEALVVGDPSDEETDVSALISEKDTSRVATWIQDAVSQGARLITGGILDENSILLPSILADTTDEMEVCANEVFGPLVSVMKFSTLDEVLDRANASTYGLQAAIFTSNISSGLQAAHRLDYGGVLINETPTFRADNMPYGGIRDSGNTKEGPAWAINEMTKEKLIVISEL